MQKCKNAFTANIWPSCHFVYTQFLFCSRSQIILADACLRCSALFCADFSPSSAYLTPYRAPSTATQCPSAALAVDFRGKLCGPMADPNFDVGDALLGLRRLGLSWKVREDCSISLLLSRAGSFSLSLSLCDSPSFLVFTSSLFSFAFLITSSTSIYLYIGSVRMTLCHLPCIYQCGHPLRRMGHAFSELLGI